MSAWLEDPREISAVRTRDGEEFDLRTGDRFERIEMVGQMAMVPWMRIAATHKDGISITGARLLEVPIENVSFIEYRE